MGQSASPVKYTTGKAGGNNNSSVSIEKTHPSLFFPKTPHPDQQPPARIDATPLPKDSDKRRSSKISQDHKELKEIKEHFSDQHDVSVHSQRSRKDSHSKREESRSKDNSRSKSKGKGNDNFDKMWAEIQKKNQELETLFRENRELKSELENCKKGREKADEENEGLRDKLRKLEKLKEETHKNAIKCNGSTDDLLLRYTLLATIVSWGDYDAKLKKFEIQRLNEELGRENC